jgi:ketosteroid isomerase-like protein
MTMRSAGSSNAGCAPFMRARSKVYSLIMRRTSVMFDVPPPYEGIQGIDAYRDSWPGFFEWQASGAVFELDSLHITAGETVAFAFGLLRCGTNADFDRDPTQRLRLTIGLRKTNDRWTAHSRASLVRRHEQLAIADGLSRALAARQQGCACHVLQPDAVAVD